MKQETKRPLYKVLNEQRSSEDNKIAITDQSDYMELAVNNLHHLAEALEEILWAQENMGTIKNTTALYKAKEALARIS